MPAKVKFDVWLKTGVVVSVPAGTSPDSPDGMKVIMAQAMARFKELIDIGAVEVTVEPFEWTFHTDD